jgi:hypothetical protein
VPGDGTVISQSAAAVPGDGTVASRCAAAVPGDGTSSWMKIIQYWSPSSDKQETIHIIEKTYNYFKHEIHPNIL